MARPSKADVLAARAAKNQKEREDLVASLEAKRLAEEARVSTKNFFEGVFVR